MRRILIRFVLRECEILRRRMVVNKWFLNTGSAMAYTSGVWRDLLYMFEPMAVLRLGRHPCGRQPRHADFCACGSWPCSVAVGRPLPTSNPKLPQTHEVCGHPAVCVALRRNVHLGQRVAQSVAQEHAARDLLALAFVSSERRKRVQLVACWCFPRITASSQRLLRESATGLTGVAAVESCCACRRRFCSRCRAIR